MLTKYPKAVTSCPGKLRAGLTRNHPLAAAGLAGKRRFTRRAVRGQSWLDRRLVSAEEEKPPYAASQRQSAWPRLSTYKPRNHSAQNHTARSSQNKHHGKCQRALSALISLTFPPKPGLEPPSDPVFPEERSGQPEPSFPAQLLQLFAP